MPRERVHHGAILARIPEPNADGSEVEYSMKRYTPGDDLPEGSTVHEEPSLEVSWNRDGEWVQVAFVAPREWFEKALADTAEHVDPHGPAIFTAYTNVLTRAELNHMIRTLRRARDTAYGADE